MHWRVGHVTALAGITSFTPTPQGILQKKPFFFFLYALETTQPKPLHPPDRQANPSLTPSLDLLLFGTANQAPTLPLLWNCHRPYPPPTLSCNQGPWSTSPSTGPAPVGTPPTPQGILQKTPCFFFLYALETTKIRHTLRNLLHPWGPCLYHRPASLTPRPPVGTHPAFPRQANPSLTPSPGIKSWSTSPSTRPAPVGTTPLRKDCEKAKTP